VAPRGAGGAVVDASLDAATGCGLVGAPTGVLGSQTITVGSQARTYVLSVPRSYDPNTPCPWYSAGTVTVPREPSRARCSASSPRQRVARSSCIRMPSAAGATDWDYTATGRDVELFDTLVDYLTSTYCVDRARIFSTGLSAGAYFTNLLGCCRGDVLRAIAPVAGGPPSAATCAGHVGAWIAHASNDPLVDFTTGGIATRDFWIARNGCSTTLAPVAVSPADCVEYQGCQPDLPVVWCVHTEGHSWPSMANCSTAAYVSTPARRFGRSSRASGSVHRIPSTVLAIERQPVDAEVERDSRSAGRSCATTKSANARVFGSTTLSLAPP